MTKKRLITALAALMLMTGAVNSSEILSQEPISRLSRDFAQDVLNTRSSVFEFNELFPGGRGGLLDLSGVNNIILLDFSIKRDEIVTKAKLDFSFTSSPALIPTRSHLNVYLNGTIQKTIPIEKEMLGKAVNAEVELDPLLIMEFNQLSFELIGHYQDVCENPANSAIWLKIKPSGKLVLTTQKLKVNNELSFLPSPFVDTATSRSTSLPIILPKDLEDGILEAAGIVASWAGTKADWRGISFPVHESIPAEDTHLVAFATNERKPDFLKNLLPEFKNPTIMLMDSPGSTFAKILLIGAPDAAGLKTAAAALASGEKILTGDKTEIIKKVELAPRVPYDAPKWIDVTKPVHFRDLIEYEGQLTSRGYKTAPITLSMRLPPDLFMVDKQGVPLELKYRYTKPDPHTYSQMRFLLNDRLVDSYPLKAEKNSNSIFALLPALNSIFDFLNSTAVPAIVLNHQNTLTFDFQYGMSIDGGNGENCRSSFLIPQQVEIDPASQLDLSGFHHFAELPDLSRFINSGFPYTRMADLSETILVLPQNPKASQIQTMLNLVGRLSAQSGLAASGVTVTTDGKRDLKGKDIIFIDELPEAFPAQPETDILATVKETKRYVEVGRNPESQQKRVKENFEKVQAIETSSSGPIALITGFESPYEKGRSAVALMTASEAGTDLLNSRLLVSSDLSKVHGSISIIRESGVNSFRVGDVYYVGSLPWYKKIWFMLEENPIFLVLGSVLGVIILASALYCLLKFLTDIRLNAQRGRKK